MPLVVDSSSIIPLAMADEERGYALSVVRELSKTEGHVSSMFWWELWNVMRSNAALKGRINVNDANNFLLTIEGLDLAVAPAPPNPKIFAIAVDFNVSAYDASYLELARSLNCSLASTDKNLRRASRDAGVNLFDP